MHIWGGLSVPGGAEAKGRCDRDLAVAGVRHAAARGLTLRAAVSAIAAQDGLSERTLWRWLAGADAGEARTQWRPSEDDLAVYALWGQRLRRLASAPRRRRRRSLAAGVPAGHRRRAHGGPAGRPEGGGERQAGVRRLPALGARGPQRPLGGRSQAARHRRPGGRLRPTGPSLVHALRRGVLPGDPGLGPVGASPLGVDPGRLRCRRGRDAVQAMGRRSGPPAGGPWCGLPVRGRAGGLRAPRCRPRSGPALLAVPEGEGGGGGQADRPGAAASAARLPGVGARDPGGAPGAHHLRPAGGAPALGDRRVEHRPCPPDPRLHPGRGVGAGRHAHPHRRGGPAALDDAGRGPGAPCRRRACASAGGTSPPRS